MGSPPTEQEGYQLSCNDVGDGFAAKASAVTPNIDRVRPDVFVSSAEPTNLSEGSRGVGAAAEAPKTTATVEGSVSRGASALTAHTLPPLMNGARYSTPPKELHTTGLAPYSTPGVTFTGIDGRDKTYPVRQQAWAEQEEGDKGEEFPFLTGNRILPDDHFEVCLLNHPSELFSSNPCSLLNYLLSVKDMHQITCLSSVKGMPITSSIL